MTKPWHGDGAPADPVERAHECINSGDAVGTVEKQMTELMADLAALCEWLSETGCWSQCKTGIIMTPEQKRLVAMKHVHNPDGTRRWPGVGDD